MGSQGCRGDGFHVKVVKRLATFVSMACPVRILEYMFRGLQRILGETYYIPSLIKQIDVYVVVEYTVTILLTSETYCIKHFICLVDIVFSSAEKAPAKRIRNAPVKR